jgi:raffinose/stachyose/melibiose transport system permease protein
VTRYSPRTLLVELVMIVVACVFFFPVWVLLSLSLKPPGEVSSTFSPPTHPTLRNYADAWQQASLGGALVNSLVVTVTSVAVIVVVSALAAYPLARSTRHWSRLTFALFILGLLVPFQLGMIPLYQTIRDLGLLGNLGSLILFYSGLQMPFSVFLYATFLRGVPVDYEEAAVLDGCGPLAAFWRVVFPLLRPVTGTVVILNSIHVWNDFLTPLLYLSGSAHQTIPVAIFGFVGQYVSQWNLVFAGLVIGIAPVLAAYFLMQRRIIQGFAGGLRA